MSVCTRWALLAVLTAASALFASTASAHMVWHAKKPQKMAPAKELSYANYSLHHAKKVVVKAKQTLGWFRNHPSIRYSADTITRTNAALVVGATKLRLRDHRWLVRYSLRLRRDALSRLQPDGSVGSVGHRAGWLCIHKGEGAWDANTGNGYYGGLQAHLGWGGVPRMDKLSADRQMAVAEYELRQNHYSHAWLASQWPNTYPPCAHLF